VVFTAVASHQNEGHMIAYTKSAQDFSPPLAKPAFVLRQPLQCCSGFGYIAGSDCLDDILVEI